METLAIVLAILCVALSVDYALSEDKEYGWAPGLFLLAALAAGVYVAVA